MKILYGLAGEGMGHATRSKVVISHLIKNHQVKIIVSNRAYDFMTKSFPDVVKIYGFELSYIDGTLDLAGSLAINIKDIQHKLIRNASVYQQIEKYAPNLIISDFDSFTYIYAKSHNLPILSIDNLQMLPRCFHDEVLFNNYPSDMKVFQDLINLKMLGCDHYVITTFFQLPVKPNFIHTTTLIPPIVRDEICFAKPTLQKDHIIVYQTSTSDTRIVDILNLFPLQQFIVYGLRRDETRHNCTLKNFSEQGFIDDLTSARAVISNGGMSLIGEAIYLGKPIYSVPVRKHMEQIINAHYVQALGYGITSEWLDPGMIRSFIAAIPQYAQNLHNIPRQDGNHVLYQTIDGFLGPAIK